MLAPFFVMLVVTLWPIEALLARRFPLSQITLNNFPEVLRVLPFGRYFLNSAMVTVTVTVLQILISSLAAFAFARLRFAGRDDLPALPGDAHDPGPGDAESELPDHQEPGLVRHLPGADRPGAVQRIDTFLLRQYYRGIPLDLDKAARIDSASSLRIWRQISSHSVGR